MGWGRWARADGPQGPPSVGVYSGARGRWGPMGVYSRAQRRWGPKGSMGLGDPPWGSIQRPRGGVDRAGIPPPPPKILTSRSSSRLRAPPRGPVMVHLRVHLPEAPTAPAPIWGPMGGPEGSIRRSRWARASGPGPTGLKDPGPIQTRKVEPL